MVAACVCPSPSLSSLFLPPSLSLAPGCFVSTYVRSHDEFGRPRHLQPAKEATRGHKRPQKRPQKRPHEAARGHSRVEFLRHGAACVSVRRVQGLRVCAARVLKAKQASSTSVPSVPTSLAAPLACPRSCPTTRCARCALPAACMLKTGQAGRIPSAPPSLSVPAPLACPIDTLCLHHPLCPHHPLCIVTPCVAHMPPCAASSSHLDHVDEGRECDQACQGTCS